VFEKNNKFVSSQNSDDDPSVIDPDARFLGLLCKKNDAKKKKSDFNEIQSEE
jgi:hypothetical protein